MSVMVTGIGFIGGHVVRDLLAAGEDVVLYGLFGGKDEQDETRPDLAYLDDLLDGLDHPGTMTVVVGDIRDLPRIRHTVEEHGVRSIAHLASLVSGASEADVPRAIDINIDGTVNIFRAAADTGVERVVWASSINVYGPRSFAHGDVIDDESPLDPSTVYGSCKAFLERLASAYHRNHGLNAVGLRLSRVYGFGEHTKAGRPGGSTFLDGLLRIPATGAGPAVIPFGDQEIDLQYVEDVSAAFVQALGRREGAGETFLTSGDRRPIAEAFEFVKTLLPDADIRLATDAESAQLPKGAQKNWAYRFDPSRAERVLGIKSTYPMEEGFFRTISAYRNYAGLPPLDRG